MVHVCYGYLRLRKHVQPNIGTCGMLECTKNHFRWLEGAEELNSGNILNQNGLVYYIFYGILIGFHVGLVMLAYFQQLCFNQHKSM